MKHLLFIVIILVAFAVNGQTITTIAGGGSGGDGSPATSANVNNPSYLTFDQDGNLYFTENGGHKVRKIGIFGIISTIAGTGSIGFSGDGGPATAAKLNQPAGIAIDASGNVLFADGVNNRIRKVDKTTGIISTIAGIATAGYNGDGIAASAASLRLPDGIWMDKTYNLFICDAGNNRLRKITSSGIISTVAGIGLAGWGGNGGMATATRCYPWGNINMDLAGNLYFTEYTWGVVRKINAAGIITTVAGDTSSHLYNGDNIPATNAHIDPFGLAFDGNGRMYFSDSYNNRLRTNDASGIIHTIAGNGVAGSTGDGGPATAAAVHSPASITFDKCGNLYFCEANNGRIRKITFNPPPCAYLTTLETITTEPSIYPNPTNDILHIDNLQIPATYKLLNIVGAAVQQGSLHKSSNSLAIQQLPAGVYMLEVSGEDGQRNVSKVIKE